MALFSNQKTKTAKAPKARVLADVKDANGTLANALKGPWLSEKALIGTEHGVYAFAIPKEATKKDVMLAVKKFYNVVPKKVNVVNLPAKKVMLRTRRGFGTKSVRRKAYVYLNKGDTIQFA
jgi:large subunit ribosomal protein L23